MRPLAVHHVSINVDDLDASAGFYVDVLGLERRHDRPDAAVADLRARRVAMSDPEPGRSRQAFLQDPAGNLVGLHEAAT